MKRYTSYIKRPATSKSVLVNSDSDDSVKVMSNKKARTSVLLNLKQQVKNTHNHHGSHRYCVICKKTGIPERKWKFNSSENLFGKISYHASVKYRLGGALVNIAYAVNHYQKTEKKWKRELKLSVKAKAIRC